VDSKITLSVHSASAFLDLHQDYKAFIGSKCSTVQTKYSPEFLYQVVLAPSVTGNIIGSFQLLETVPWHSGLTKYPLA
jgi:hypothetical protein